MGIQRTSTSCTSRILIRSCIAIYNTYPPRFIDTFLKFFFIFGHYFNFSWEMNWLNFWYIWQSLCLNKSIYKTAFKNSPAHRFIIIPPNFSIWWEKCLGIKLECPPSFLIHAFKKIKFTYTQNRSWQNRYHRV